MKSLRFLFLLVCITLLEGSDAFTPSPKLSVRVKTLKGRQSNGQFWGYGRESSTRNPRVVCQQSVDPNEIIGIRRGYPILAFFVILSAWFFTIPPEFRRAQFCASDVCLQNRCNDCMSVEEWTTGIKNYYQNGGGIKWDFSIDPNSKMKLSG